MAIVFNTNYDNFSATATSSWVEIDLSSYVSANATGVIIQIEESQSTTQTGGIRAVGSTDTFTQDINNNRVQLICGLDANKKIEIYNTSLALLKFYVVGYFEDESVFFDDFIEITTGATNNWNDTDITSHVGTDAGSVEAAIIYWDNTGTSSKSIGTRKNGSTVATAESSMGHFARVVGVDSSDILEQYRSDAAFHLYLVGYVKTSGNLTMLTDPVVLTESTVDAWTDKDLTANTSSSTNGVFLTIHIDTSDNALCRANGSTDDLLKVSYPLQPQMVATDSSQIIEIYTGVATNEFYLDGYIETSGTPTLTVADANSASSADDITIEQSGGTLTVADADSSSSADDVTITQEISELVVEDADSASSADDITLIGELVVEDADSSSSADEITITQSGGTLSVENADSTSSADEVALQFNGTLTVDDADSTSSADEVTLEQSGGTLTIENADSASSVDDVTLIAAGTLSVENADSGSSADDVTLEQSGGILTVEDADSSSSADDVSLIFAGTLSVADADSTSSADEVTVEQSGGTLSVEDVNSTSDADTIALGAAGTLSVEDAESGSSADAVALEGSVYPEDADSASSVDDVTLEQSGGTLTVEDVDSSSSSDEVTLQFAGTLNVEDADSSSSADEVTLEQTGGTLTVEDADSASTADTISLGAQGTLSVENADSASSVDTVALEGSVYPENADSSSSVDDITIEQSGGTLTVENADSASNADDVTLQFAGTFTVEDADSTSSAGDVTLEQTGGTLTVEDVDSSASADNVTMSQDGGVLTVEDADSAISADTVVMQSEDIPKYNANKGLILDSLGGYCLQLGNTKVNSWNTLGRPTSPKDGTIGFNTDFDNLEVYTNSIWNIVGTVLPIDTKTSDYTATAYDYTIIVDGTSNTVTITLPTAVGIDGRIYNLKCINETHNCFVNTTGSETIDGELTQTLYETDSICVQSDGANWVII